MHSTHSALRHSEAEEQRLFVSLLSHYFFILQTDISALAGRIFVIIVPFDWNSLRF